MAIIFGLLFLGFSLWTLYFDLWPMLRFGRASQNWPTVKGHIDRSSVKEHYNRGGRSYTAEIEYSYRIDKVWHKSKRVKFGYRYLPHLRNRAEQLVNQFPTAANVQVYYHPTKPEISTLIPGISILHLLAGTVFTVLYIAIGIVTLLGLFNATWFNVVFVGGIVLMIVFNVFVKE